MAYPAFFGGGAGQAATLVPMFQAWMLTAFAIGGAAGGVFLGRSRNLPPRIAALGSGLLLGISLFWMLPEMAGESGWIAGVLSLAAGAGLLWTVDHFIYSICPSCSHTHDHDDCGEPPLHGFGAPLLIAMGVHSFIDGWSIRLLSGSGLGGWAVPLGLGLHKIPEGVALGLIAREAMTSGRRAFLSCALAESFTLVGALLEPRLDRAGATQFGGWWITGVLAFTGGSFLFLSFHTIHGSREQPGVLAVFVLTLCGMAALAAVHWRFGAI